MERKDFALYNGEKDYVEIIKLMSDPRKFDINIDCLKLRRNVEEIYLPLTQQEIQLVKEHVSELIESDYIDEAEEVLMALVCIVETDINECLTALINKEYYRCSTIFKNASAEVRDLLIERIETEDGERHNILCALSLIGDQTVFNLFNEWKNNPPEWINELYKPLDNYSLVAGWQLSEDGKNKNLFSYDCYPIKKENLTSKDPEPLLLLEKFEEKCNWCGTTMTTLFDFMLSDKIFDSFNIHGRRLRIVTCHICSCYTTVYRDIDFDGNSTLSEFNQKPSYLPEINPEEESIISKNSLKISRNKRSYFYGLNNRFIGISASQIGGLPRWEQEPEYPLCPKCNNTMMFLGQLQGSDIVEFGAGIYYAFICHECKISATSYQCD
ncbi:MAG: DUF1963 domain-containing protein [Bacillota bacterium]|nr:DUF1963 domain-containing protein [Bacillota bacterium]